MEAVVADPRVFQIVVQVMATILLIFFVKKYTQQNFINYLQKRKQFVNDSLEETKQNSQKAADLLKEASIQEEDMRAKKAQVMETSQIEAKREKEQIIQDSKMQAKQIIEKANEEAESSREGLMKDVSSEVAQLVALVSEKFLADNMSDDANMSLISQALEEVENENK